MEEDIKVVDTDSHEKDGSKRCPSCGSSDITYNIKKKKLLCNYCGTEFADESIEELEKSAKDLDGEVRGSGTKDIKKSDDIITLECDGCGAEVVINTNEATNARCHWCRNLLSINSQIENGAIPDMVLPFQLDKSEAETKIKSFVSDRLKYADKTFKNEFKTDNIMGVYFPYMLVDAKGHGNFYGEGEHLIRKYTVKKDDDKEETLYDADLYKVERKFDFAIDDLTIESSLDKLTNKDKSRTTNVINAIMPFDTENCVKYKPNYLAGFTSEKRDLNIKNIDKKVEAELKDITRHTLNNEIKFYDRGVKWDKEDITTSGKQWVSAYLPVWLYSYQDKNKVLHYVAVNGRTGETMGSVPISKAKVWLSLLVVETIIFIILYLLLHQKINWILFIFASIIPFIIYLSKFSYYRNKGARHTYESETKCTLSNISNVDEKIKKRTELSSSMMIGANNNRVSGTSVKVEEDSE